MIDDVDDHVLKGIAMLVIMAAYTTATANGRPISFALWYALLVPLVWAAYICWIDPWGDVEIDEVA